MHAAIRERLVDHPTKADGAAVRVRRRPTRRHIAALVGGFRIHSPACTGAWLHCEVCAGVWLHSGAFTTWLNNGEAVTGPQPLITIFTVHEESENTQ